MKTYTNEQVEKMVANIEKASKEASTETLLNRIFTMVGDLIEDKKLSIELDGYIQEILTREATTGKVYNNSSKDYTLEIGQTFDDMSTWQLLMVLFNTQGDRYFDVKEEALYYTIKDIVMSRQPK